MMQRVHIVMGIGGIAANGDEIHCQDRPLWGLKGGGSTRVIRRGPAVMLRRRAAVELIDKNQSQQCI